jgi:putative redox protein
VTDFEIVSYRVKFPGGVDGVQLAGIIDRPDPMSDQGAPFEVPVVVYSHCFTCNKDLKSTVRISRALAKSGVAVLRFDMMGLGGSEGGFSDSNFTTNLADLASAIRFADAELGPVTGLVGHSFGGVASLVMASRATEPGTALPLSDLGFVATLAAPSDTHHLATLLARLSPEIESKGIGTVTIGGFSWKIYRQMLDDFRRHDITAKLPGIRCPVLLMHSPVDETVGYDHALRLMSLIQTDREAGGEITPVSLVALPGADHLLINHPEDITFVARLIAAWCHHN